LEDFRSHARPFRLRQVSLVPPLSFSMYASKIKELETKISQAQSTIEQADDLINAAKERIETTKDGFEATLRAIMNEIDRDIMNIQQYL
jgi:predicted  nucleic acid-binding Zn-ribbon protein